MKIVMRSESGCIRIEFSPEAKPELEARLIALGWRTEYPNEREAERKLDLFRVKGL